MRNWTGEEKTGPFPQDRPGRGDRSSGLRGDPRSIRYVTQDKADRPATAGRLGISSGVGLP